MKMMRMEKATRKKLETKEHRATEQLKDAVVKAMGKLDMVGGYRAIYHRLIHSRDDFGRLGEKLPVAPHKVQYV